METAPRDRPIAVLATHALAADTPFITKAHYDDALGWVAKDEPENGLPSLGLVSLNAKAWMYL
jgi:hypothetical protein